MIFIFVCDLSDVFLDVEVTDDPSCCITFSINRRNGMGPGISEEAIRSMQIKLKEQGRGGTQYIAASASECVRPMMEVAWPPMLACFSLPMEESDDPHTVHLCLDGFKV